MAMGPWLIKDSRPLLCGAVEMEQRSKDVEVGGRMPSPLLACGLWNAVGIALLVP